MNAAALTARAEALLADRAEASAFADLYDAAPASLKARFGLRVERLAGATALIAPGLPTTMFNRVIGVGLDRAATPADIEQLLALYRDAAVGRWWLHWSPFAEPSGGNALLAPFGFAAPARRSWAKMLRATAAPPQPDTDLRVELATQAQVAEATTCITQVFDMPLFIADWMAMLHGRPPWRVYAINDGTQIVGGACLFVDGDTGWLGMGGVVASHRRRRRLRLHPGRHRNRRADWRRAEPVAGQHAARRISLRCG